MQFTLSRHAEEAMARRGIQRAWLETAMGQPDEVRNDPDDPDLRHAIKRIEERDGRALRVIYNSRTAPVRIVTAFFDRRLREQR